MLQAKFQDHMTSGSGEVFLKLFTIYGHGHPHFQRRLQIKFGFDWPSDFSGEDV